MTEISIRPAESKDAAFIGWGICEAIGTDLVVQLAVNTDANTVQTLFSSLAARSDTQYSWTNALIAEVDGTPVGVAVAYDGADLLQLREPFIEAANDVLGIDFTGIPSESEDGEFYLDTLAVDPKYRGHGIATKLIEMTIRRASQQGKPLGLLVSDHNPNGRKLYDKCGFKAVGRRPFAGEEMTHMQK